MGVYIKAHVRTFDGELFHLAYGDWHGHDADAYTADMLESSRQFQRVGVSSVLGTCVRLSQQQVVLSLGMDG